MTASPRKVHTLLHDWLFLEIHVLKRARRGKLVLGVYEEILGKRVLVRALLLALYDLVKEIQVVPEFVQHPALIILVARIHKLL